MKTKTLIQKLLLAMGHVMPGLMFLMLTRQAEANPTGMTVQSGQASAAVNGSQLTVTAGNNAVLNWQSFNIAQGESTIFRQPSAASVVWNNIGGQSASQIYGTLQANGIVVLLNSSGFYFGPNSYVSAAGLVVSTANCLPPQNAGGAWTFNGPPPLASIVNYGEIQIGHGGSAYLIADKVENHGAIEAPGGEVGLAAGRTVTLNERPDGRGIGMKVTLPQGSVNNYGTLLADAGAISLQAKVVNQDGFIQANSVRQVNGVIELVASDGLNLGAHSKISARGDASPQGSRGGEITLKSASEFTDVTGSEISVAGGVNGGNGGAVEVSATKMAAVHSRIDGTAKAGHTGGKLLLDPDYINLGSFGFDTTGGDGTVEAGDDPGATLNMNVNFSFFGFSEITLQAAYDIMISDGTAWNLSGSTGQNSGHLVLEAGGSIYFGTGAGVFDNNNWSIEMYAGVTDFAQKKVQPGMGSIYLDSSDSFSPSYVQTYSGSIKLVAGQDITLGLGYVNTTGGGNINAHALAGSINTGGVNQGYFVQGAETTDQALLLGYFAGGISTLAGGNVNLTAGASVTSLLPAQGGYYYNGVLNLTPGILDGTAGSGAYGNQPGQSGNVTIVAGGDVTGHYLVANGKGKIVAGAQMDADGNPVMSGGNYMLGSTGNAGLDSKANALALSLISTENVADRSTIHDGWDVIAGNDINLQEVRNPNGVFNTFAGTTHHLFDYAPADYVNLTAGNAVVLGSTVLPRVGGDGLSVPIIYPSILDITAGAGGVDFTGGSAFNQLILFPSPQGSLVINTVDGGPLFSALPAIGGKPQYFSLIVSDGVGNQFTANSTWGKNDHAATPIHYGHATAVELNISGDMTLINLIAPEAAEINVVGNMYSSRFQGMNLLPDDVTSINLGQIAKLNMEAKGILNPATDGGLVIGGDIINRSAFTSVVLDSTEPAPNLAALADATGNTVNGIPVSAITLLSSFFFSPPPAGSTGINGTLTYQDIAIPGITLEGVLGLLQNLTVPKRDGRGNPEVDAEGNPVYTQISVINANTAAALLAQYNALNESQGLVPFGNDGYTLGGGGAFAINARNVDLGTSAGVQSVGVGLYKVGGDYPLASYFNLGANIDLELSGDLTMFSSSVASLNGGKIYVRAHGKVNVGSADFTVNSFAARGIYTSNHADTTVIADGDVNVNGSRIAAYDGGNVTVESLHGNINAGTGGSGFVALNSFIVDPKTHKVAVSSPTIPGSGILATTFPTDPQQVVGNILVEAPEGSVIASSGGIVQLPLNKAADNAKAIVMVLAGYELRDANHNPLTAEHIANGIAEKTKDGMNIDASGSGIIGENVIAQATGLFKGVVFGQNNVSLTSPKLSDLTVLGQTVQTEGSLGPTVTLIGTESVSTGGASGGATILSQNANGGGSTFAQGTAANATSAAASASNDAANAAATKSDTAGVDDDSKNKKPITLARKISRVTVLLGGGN